MSEDRKPSRERPDVGHRIYDSLSQGERDHLVAAMREAALSAEGDHTDDWLCALGNAGIGLPNRAGRPITETQQRIVCAELERAKRSDLTDEYDWGRLLQGAFGMSSRDRLRALCGDALVRSGEHGTRIARRTSVDP